VHQLQLWKRGGRRAGAGRKPNGAKAVVSRAKREAISKHVPALVTLKLRAGLPSLRRDGAFGSALRCLEAARARFGLRVIHFSFQSNHVHLLVEADDAESLARGMQGLCVRLAKAWNKLWRRKGSVFADRYHSRPLRTPREVRNALVYVLNNNAKHGIRLASFDPFSSASTFDGWSTRPRGALPHASRRDDSTQRAVLQARSFLLAGAWRRHGFIAWDGVPRGVA
jgi:REP element-mobilizing transposase RayT